MKKKIIAAGHICLDITPVFPDNKIGKINDILSPGKLIQMGSADVHTGGSVANTGLGMKILGADVELMGKIGNDAFGNMILTILRKYGADEHMIIADDATTSYSVVLAIPGIDRIFLHHPGANDTFSASDISHEQLSVASLLHFGYPPLMRSIYKDAGEELLNIMKTAKSMGVATSLDMAMVDAQTTAGQSNWKLILEKVLPYVDFFVPSVEELCFMIDKSKFEELQNRANGGDITDVLDIEKDVRPLADWCISKGARVILIKCGTPGIYYRTSASAALESIGAKAELNISKWADKEGFEKSYVPDRVLSGTGAGDTSIAAFLTSMLDGCTIEECVQLAAATGASCVSAYDALSGLKPLDELRSKIAAGWKKQGE